MLFIAAQSMAWCIGMYVQHDCIIIKTFQTNAITISSHVYCYGIH